MKRTEPLSITDILKEALSEQNLEDKLLERKALAVWTDIVGPEINRKTIERRVRNGTMAVRISSAPLRNELSMRRSIIIAALNQALGKEIIHTLRFL